MSEIKRSSFDPHLPEHRVEINLHALLTDVQKSVPNTGIQHPSYLQPVVDTSLFVLAQNLKLLILP